MTDQTVSLILKTLLTAGMTAITAAFCLYDFHCFAAGFMACACVCGWISDYRDWSDL